MKTIMEIKEIRGFGARIVSKDGLLEIHLGGPGNVWTVTDETFGLSPEGYAAAIEWLANSYLHFARITPKAIDLELLLENTTDEENNNETRS